MPHIKDAMSAVSQLVRTFGENALQFTSKGLGPYTGVLQGAYIAKMVIVDDPKSGESFAGYKFNRVMQSGNSKISSPDEQKEQIAREIINRVSVSLTSRNNEQYLYLGSTGLDLIGRNGELKGAFISLYDNLPENVSPKIITGGEVGFAAIRLNDRTGGLKLPRGAEDSLRFARLDL